MAPFYAEARPRACISSQAPPTPELRMAPRVVLSCVVVFAMTRQIEREKTQ